MQFYVLLLGDGTKEIIEKKLRAYTITTLKGRFAEVVMRIKEVIENTKLDVNSLIVKLCALDEDSSTIFSTDNAFEMIHNKTELFHYIGRYCSIYDYELLVGLVESTDCQEAMQLLDDFTKTLSTSILSDLDLLSDDGKPKDYMSGSHKLVITYLGGKCTLRTKELVKNIIYEHFHLNKWSIIFKDVEEGLCCFYSYINSSYIVVNSYIAIFICQHAGISQK